MSIRHLNAAWKARIEDPQAKLVLLRLADAADKNGFCWPSLNLIAAETELHRATVCRKIDLLEAGGWVSRNRIKNGTEYTLKLDNNLSHTATSSESQLVAACDTLEKETSRSQRLVALCDQSQAATQLVAQCDSTSRTVRLTNTREPSRTTIEPKNPLPPAVDGDEKTNRPVAEWWKDESEYAPCTVEQAVEYAASLKISEGAARHWWHVRHSAGWTKGTSNGHARKVTSWQSDLVASKRWAEEEAHRPTNGHAPKRRELTSNDVTL